MTPSLPAELEILFESGHVPPPYSHVYSLKLRPQDTGIAVDFALHYTHRDELSLEEIIDEGFNEDDDYTYSGTVSVVWRGPLKDLWNHTDWMEMSSFEDGGISMRIEEGEERVPKQQEAWSFLAQEIIQAIYEQAGKEAPLFLAFLKVDKQGPVEVELQLSFAQRKAEAMVNGQLVSLSWEKTKKLLTDVYLPDYDYEHVATKKPTKRGNYIDLGDGNWFELGKTVQNIDSSYDAIAGIRKGFEAIIEKAK
ncbi:hypothetical protein A3SI_04882 [Nitritalea halalkaliphila LW7]|uniref:Uncharacterized protein n=1 Tax=Nitritalea halalkaliphila LW7 TaxID=1189621 RepID=I5C8E9_9BACT|nr:hypothetical protein [Nitritalea halalkaliphila]EIM78101.1 hypothetical protein A3SI_04882 [Nitritalea halalkaliphila LW7]